MELPFATVAAALRAAKDGGATTILNPAPAAAALDEFGGLVDIATPNEHEAALIAGVDGLSPEKAAAAVADRLGCRAVVLTLGSEGLLAWQDGNVEVIPPHAVEVRDTVGAGDAVCGALAAALAAGEDLGAAARRGNAAGALAVTVAGAEPSMPTAAAIGRLLAG